MTAYYNEIDPFCVEWLRNLIKEGLIAPGDVDNRDIRDVIPAELMGYDQCHFFAGIGGWSYALRLAGWPDDRPVWTGSCPCQPFSAAGRRAGFADERHLWPFWFHHVSVCRPPIIFGEQVASKDGLQWLDLVSADLEGAGYAVGATDLCAAGVGAPHIRQRLWFVGHAQSDEQRGLSITSMHREGVEAGRSGSFIDMGHAPGKRLPKRECNRRLSSKAAGTPQGKVFIGTGFQSGPLAYAHERPDLEGQPWAVIGAIPEADGGVCAVADSRCEPKGRRLLGPGEGIETGKGWASDKSIRSGDHSILAHPPDRSIQESGRGPEGRDGDGAVNPWQNCEWLPCRDGKYRPTKPGLSPLAHGVPGRVEKLRAAGNAIVPEVAAEFIKAYLARTTLPTRSPQA